VNTPSIRSGDTRALEDAFSTVCRRVIPPGCATALIAVSGGADSIALWTLFHAQARWRVVAYHLDHALRPDSADDARWVAEFAARLGSVELITECADIADLARTWRCGIEAAGRRHRYARLRAVAAHIGAGVIATAHHRDDQSETVLMNLLRGAGEAGRRGIPERRDLEGVPLVRPLLEFERSRLREYLRERGLAWKEDASNDDERFRRNVIRHRVLPVLEQGVPGISAALAALATEGGAVTADSWPEAIAARRIDVAVYSITIAAVRTRRWRQLLLDLGIEPTRDRIRRLEVLASGPSGHAYEVGRWLFERVPNAIRWQEARVARNGEAIVITGPGTFHRGDEYLLLDVGAPPSDPAAVAGEAWFDAERVTWPLSWRLAVLGERWRPLGGPGRQTIAKFLADRKVPSRARAAVPVVADAEGVVWIPGFTIAERVRIVPGTASAAHGKVLSGELASAGDRLG
jgi:tRNA(Ile)-lysidine synthase